MVQVSLEAKMSFEADFHGNRLDVDQVDPFEREWQSITAGIRNGTPNFDVLPNFYEEKSERTSNGLEVASTDRPNRLSFDSVFISDTGFPASVSCEKDPLGVLTQVQASQAEAPPLQTSNPLNSDKDPLFASPNTIAVDFHRRHQDDDNGLEYFKGTDQNVDSNEAHPAAHQGPLPSNFFDTKHVSVNR